MTRKDYVLIAAAFAAARQDIYNKESDTADLLDGVNYAVDWISEALAKENPRFDVARFRHACGV